MVTSSIGSGAKGKQIQPINVVTTIQEFTGFNHIFMLSVTL